MLQPVAVLHLPLWFQGDTYMQEQYTLQSKIVMSETIE